MDLLAVGLDGLVGSDATATTTSGFASLASDPESKQKWYGSGFLKQERSGATEDDWRSSKLPKTDDISASKASMLLHHRNSLLRSNATPFSDGHMLSFSSLKSDQASPLPFSYHPITAYTRNTGIYTLAFFALFSFLSLGFEGNLGKGKRCAFC